MQITDTVLMVEPAAFSFNPETAANNYFQNPADSHTGDLQKEALREFQSFADLLRKQGIRVILIKDTPDPPKPDALFPNNWFCTASTGTITIFPLFAQSRRPEKREDILQLLKQEFEIKEVCNWSRYEKESAFLEGTGSLVLDHDHKKVYAGISPRTSQSLVKKFAAAHGYETLIFTALDRQQRPVYHTNVMMCIGENFCILCADAIADAFERKQVIASLQASGRQLICIGIEQMESFAGNMLQLKNLREEKFIVMSTTAFRSLRPIQLGWLQRHGKLLVADVPLIEKVEGGSVRCMLAEIFLPRRS